MYKNKNKSNYWIWGLLCFASLLIFVGIYSIFIFTDKDTIEEFTDTGQIGDTIGGIMNPFISIAAVIVTGLAFYAQYQANKQVKDQFDRQRFENQFYEMLRQHKENFKNIQVEKCNRNTSQNIRGSRMHTNNSETVENGISKKKIYKGNDAIREFSRILVNNKLIYHIQLPQLSQLSQYHQYLFRIIKFVVIKNKDLLREEEKSDYLEMLRLQLSDEEVKMLFYRWCNGEIQEWENEKNNFFTKYKMLYYFVYSDIKEKDDLYKNKLKELVKKYQEQGGQGNLFEIGDDIDKNFS